MIYTEEKYPYLLNRIMEHIEYVKAHEPETSLLHIITDFSLKFNVDIETIGDAIASDVYFKSFIQKDCEFHRVFRTENAVEEW